MENKCTVLVNSCDLYEDIWYPFFTLLKKYWPDNPYPIVMNTESKSCEFPGLNITTYHLYSKPNEVPWSKRLMAHLEKIETPYVLLLMEDFFIKEPVDQSVIEQCIAWMDENPNIATFDMYMTTHGKVKSEKYPGFSKRKRFSEYKYNTEAAIWRKEDLLKSLREFEDPWVWEFIGNLRSFRTSKEFYVTSDDVRPNFNYYTAAVARGKWNLAVVDPVFKANGIEIDYSVRGYRTEEDGLRYTVEGNKADKLGKLRIVHSYLVNIPRHFRSLF